MSKIQQTKYPFVEGDEYYTLDSLQGAEGAVEPILSVWDDESEIMHDANPNQTYYFVSSGRLWKKHLRFPNHSSSPDAYLYYQSAI